MISFDGSNIDTSKGTFQPLPAGTYTLKANSVDLRASKMNPDSSYLKVEYEVTAGEHTGKRVFQNFTWQNSNAQAVEIGHRDLTRHLMATVGQPAVDDLNRTCNIEFTAKVTQRANKGMGTTENVISEWSKLTQRAPQSFGATTQQPQNNMAHTQQAHVNMNTAQPVDPFATR